MFNLPPIHAPDRDGWSGEERWAGVIATDQVHMGLAGGGSGEAGSDPSRSARSMQPCLDLIKRPSPSSVPCISYLQLSRQI